MPRIQVPGFIGPSNKLASITADAEVTYNWLLESVSPATDPKRPVWHRQTPGLQLFASGSNGWVRGLYALNDQAFAVIGTEFCEIFGDGTVTVIGTVTDDNEPASICSNGTAGGQVFICSGQNGYIYNLNTSAFGIIADPDFPNGDAQMGEFLDGYFLVLKHDTRTVYYSALEDGTKWAALDVFERSTAADNLVAIIRVGRLLYLMGERTSEPWYDQGDINNPFAPIGGTLINNGCVAPFSVQRVGETIIWLGKNDNGRCVVYLGESNLSGRRISTHAVELDLQRTVSPADTHGWVAQIEGHTLYVLTVPGEIDGSWTYDLSVDRWFKWAHWNPTLAQFEQYRGNCHMFVFNRHLVGDFQSPTIYDLSFDHMTDELVTP